ncbi:MAG: amidoligase family protein [Pseudomonas sp.]
MTAPSPVLRLPTRLHTNTGLMRRVGVELEMSGLDIDRLTAICSRYLKLPAQMVSRYERKLSGDPAGDWRVELDFALLREMGREQRLENDLGDELRTSVEDLLKWVTTDVVPLELVSPPLPMSRLGEFDDLIALLRIAGAQGTSGSVISAFGMQFNPDLPDLQTDTITTYLKAFLCLYDWLAQRARVNLTRRLTAFAEPFPPAYVRQVIDSHYWPDQEQLIADYLQANPTRNRALDMLPLFKHLNEQQVRATTTDPLIKARPALHYRLPNSLVDQPGWGVGGAWNDWLQVESLADDSERLNACCRAYGQHLDQGLGRLLDSWRAQVERQWLNEH